VIKLSRFTLQCLILSLAALAYFVMYPTDLAGLLAPVEPVVETVKNVFSISQAISPWLYILAGVAILAWAVVRVWGRGSTA
jgi:hypothetical protein